MSDILVAYSGNNNAPHYFIISDDVGVTAVANTPAIFMGGQSRRYTMQVPASLPTGHYTFSMHRNGNNQLRSQGEFWWDNAAGEVLTETEYHYLTVGKARFDTIDAENTQIQADIAAINAGADYTARFDAIDTLLGTVNTNGDLERAAILAAVNALPNAAAIAVAVEAALLDDGDGQAFRAGLAATIEAALANEADGNATVAVFQGAVTAALTAYDVATVTNTNALATLINALNDISSADLTASLVNYGAATSADVTNAAIPLDTAIAQSRNQVLAAIAALENLTAADIQAELQTYDAATGAELAQAVTDILNSAGLTSAQAVTLTRVLNVIEADEVYSATNGTGTVTKLLKGTSTVLQTKDVTTSTECDIATSIIEQ